MISIVYISARPEPKYQWLFDSLKLQSGLFDLGQIVIVDFFAEEGDRVGHIMSEADVAGFGSITKVVPPKPNVWGGKHRLTKNNWWHVAACRNTGLIHSTGDFIAFLDDRCVLMPTWFDAVREARDSKYAVCGTYEKRTGMTVSGGHIQHGGIMTGTDSRASITSGSKMHCPGTWMFGCTFALPVEWMLKVNGVDESWDSVSMEDTHFGQMLQNNGYPIYFDPRMKMIEDRSPEAPAHNMLRSSKEKHPNDQNDKTHTLIQKIWNNKESSHPENMIIQRDAIRSGLRLPIPTSPTHDWFDGQPLAEM